MALQVYSFRAEPGFIPEGVNTRDYVRKLSEGGRVNVESPVNEKLQNLCIYLSVFALFTGLSCVYQYYRIRSLIKQIKDKRS